MNIRLLTIELQKKAEDELNEIPKRINADLDSIKEWLAKQPHLANVRKDDQHLLNFLRGSKFSLERTKEKLETFYTLRTLIPEFFSNRDPFLPEIQEILKSGAFWIPLQKSTDPVAPRILYINSSRYDPDKVNATNVMKVNLMILDILMNEDDNFNIVGHHMFQDVKGLAASLMLQVTPTFIKQSAACFRRAYPARSKGIHFINMPSVFETIVRPFLNGKHQNRIFIDSGNNFTNLHKIISPNLLPKECGGINGTLDTLIDEWKEKVESYRDWFQNDARYHSDESKRPGKPKSASDEFGIEGSFRKLEID